MLRGHSWKNHSSTFNFNQISFENKPSRRFQFLNMLSSSQDIHLMGVRAGGGHGGAQAPPKDLTVGQLS